MRVEIVGDEVYVARRIKDINKYDLKILKLFKSFNGQVEVPITTITKELRTNNQFVYQYIENTNKKIERYGMRITQKDKRNKTYILEEEE